MVGLVTVQWDGKGSSLAYVIAKSIHRRHHLNESQKGMALAELATLEHGANQYRGEDGPIGPSTLSTGRTKMVQLVHLHFPLKKQPSSPGSAPLPSSAPRLSSSTAPPKKSKPAAVFLAAWAGGAGVDYRGRTVL